MGKEETNSEVGMNWEMVKLGDMVTISKGKKHNPIENGTNRYINIENLHNALNSLFTNESGVFVDEDDLIIAWDGANAGKVGVGFNGVIGSTLARMKIHSNKSDPKFLFWFLESNFELIKSQRTGATIPHVNGAALKELLIPLPPLPIQKRIAEILDAADALRRKDQELLKKYDELAQAIFIDMFGDPVKNEKGWNRIISTNYYEVRGRVGWKGYKKTDLRQKGAIVLGATHVTNTGEIDLSKVVYLSEEKFAESPEIAVQKDDLIFVQRGNTIGKVALVRADLGNATINPVVLIFRPLNANPLFLLYLILNKEQNREFVKSNSGSAQPMITQEFMRNYVFIDVPSKNQEMFANKIKLVEALKVKSQISNNLSDTFFNSFLQKAFKGELSESGFSGFKNLQD